MLLAVLAVPAGLAASDAERTAQASVDGQTILLHGRPFFPIMLIDQCDPGASARARTLGVNLILNEACSGVSAKRQLARVTPGSFAVLPMSGRGTQGAHLVGWTFPDEPDNNGWSPARLQRTFDFRAGSPDGLLSFLTTTGGFFGGVYRTPSVSLATFSQFTHIPDVAGFDLYPLNHCQQDLSVVADAQRQFTRLAGDRPTFQWIETGPIRPTYCGGFTMTPQELGAEAWLAIVGGARGIGFFTHTWSPGHSSFDVSPALRAAIKRTSASIKALEPGLTGRTVPSSSASSAVRVLARVAQGKTYIFAVNASNAPVQAQLTVPSLGNTPLGLFGEHGSRTVTTGTFDDSFGPYGLHFYIART
jgi:hypothetical protein